MRPGDLISHYRVVGRRPSGGARRDDPLTFAAVSPLVPLAACDVPARPAMKVDPILALRVS